MLLGEIEALCHSTRPASQQQIAQATLEAFAKPVTMFLPRSSKSMIVYDPTSDRSGLRCHGCTQHELHGNLLCCLQAEPVVMLDIRLSYLNVQGQPADRRVEAARRSGHVR